MKQERASCCGSDSDRASGRALRKLCDDGSQLVDDGRVADLAVGVAVAGGDAE
jgi:hypothetical protein